MPNIILIPLRFIVAPVIEPFVKSNISLSEGRRLKVTCKVSGKPLPNVFWYYTNESIHRLNMTEVVRNNTLLIRQARPSNSGLYQCYAHNRLGNAERTLRIQVHGTYHRDAHAKMPQSCYSLLLLQVWYRNDIIAVSDLRLQKAVQNWCYQTVTVCRLVSAVSVWCNRMIQVCSLQICYTV